MNRHQKRPNAIRSATELQAALNKVRCPSHVVALHRWAQAAWRQYAYNIAIHEAAHAVAAYALSGRVYSASVEAVDGRLGIVDSRCIHPAVRREEEVAFRLAGPLAEARYMNVPFETTFAASSDRERIEERIRAWNGTGVAYNKTNIFREAFSIANRIVKEEWSAVARVAKALADRRRLEREELEPMIDANLSWGLD